MYTHKNCQFGKREFSGIFPLAGGNFVISKREFPVALVPVLSPLEDNVKIRKVVVAITAVSVYYEMQTTNTSNTSN